MQLFHNAGSPFCRKVDLVLHELGRFDAVKRVPVRGLPTDPGAMPVNVNPLGKIPVLVRDDGPALYDSRVICRFLDATFRGRLYPQSRRWETTTLEALADGMMEAAVLMVYEDRCRPEEKRHSPWVEGQWVKVERALEVLTERWMSHLSGPVDVGVLSVGAALGYLDFCLADRDWRSDRPALAEWYAQMSMRPSMIATEP